MSDKNNAKTQKRYTQTTLRKKTKNAKKQRKNALQRKTAKNSNSKKKQQNKVDNFKMFVFVFVVFVLT